MPFSPVDISGGQVSGVDALGTTPSSVVNFDVDEAGVNRPRAALAAYSVTSLDSTAINGIEVWKNYLIIAYTDGTTDFIAQTAPGTATNPGLTVPGGRRPTFVSGRHGIYITAGANIRTYWPDIFSLANFTNSPLCSHIASLGQYLVSNDLANPHNFRWSDIGEGDGSDVAASPWALWPAANTTNAAARPDPIVALAENVNELFVWGSQTLQVYQVGSDPTLPFDLVSTINTGIAAPYCYVRLDENFAFLDDKRRIVISDGRSVKPISDAIQKDLRDLSTISDGFMYRTEIRQQSLLVVRFPTARKTFVYNLKASKWSEYAYYETPFQGDYPVGAYAYWPYLNRHVVGLSSSGGGLRQLDEATTTDAGSVPIVCTRTTGWHDHGTQNHKRGGRIQAILRRGTSSDPDVSDQGALEVRVQDDDKAWGDWDFVPLGSASEYENVVDLFTAGVFRRRRYETRYSSSEATAIARLHDDVTDLGF